LFIMNRLSTAERARIVHAHRLISKLDHYRKPSIDRGPRHMATVDGGTRDVLTIERDACDLRVRIEELR
jgi:hypothetical protein